MIVKETKKMGNTFLTEVEMEALENRMNGMSPQEQVFAVQFIDTDILWDELRKRETEERTFQKEMTKFVREKMG